MKKLIIFLHILISFPALAQVKMDSIILNDTIVLHDSIIKKEAVKKKDNIIKKDIIIKDDFIGKETIWSIGAFLAPNHSYINGLKLNSGETGSGMTRCNIELAISYNINKQFQITTGVKFNKFGYILNGPYQPDSLRKMVKTYTYYEFFAIPLILRYNYYGRQKWQLFAEAGAEFNHYFGERSNTYKTWSYAWRYDSLGQQAINPSAVMPFVIVGTGMEYNMFKHLFASVSVGYEISLLSLHYQSSASLPVTDLYYHLYSYYLKAGISYKF
ncbi:MAG: outer membrane beta-barrel protein [Bacteroidales bacterium]|jgi:hypothetical protein